MDSKRKQIKLVIFDLGRVLVDFDFMIAIHRLRSICALDLLKVHQLFSGSPLSEQWDKGLIAPPDFYRKVRKELSLPLTEQEFMSVWNEIFTEKHEMIQMARQLIARRQVYILSNTNRWHVDYLRAKYPWLSEFHKFIASCDVRLMKPDPEIYRLVLSRAGVEPQEAFYVDDISSYVRAAKKIGIDAVLFKNAKQFAAELDARQLK